MSYAGKWRGAGAKWDPVITGTEGGEKKRGPVYSDYTKDLGWGEGGILKCLK